MRERKFRLRIGNVIVGYEKWYSGCDGDTLSAKAQWLYSKDGKYWNPEYISHKQKDEFTGLQDKNGKEIYEGDVVLFCDEFNDIGQVVWDNRDACFSIVGKNIETNNFQEVALKIIGNIYESPELMEAQS